MNRRYFLATMSTALAASALGHASVPRPPRSRKPNLLWLIADQWRAQAVGVNGDPNARTPNIDRLANTGMNFVQARSGFPLCCPFRGTMLTSRYPNHMVPGHQYPLPPGQETIANIYNRAGYETAYFGKWHLDGFNEETGRAAYHVVPPGRRGGFKTWVGYENNNSPWDTWVSGGEGPSAFQYKLPGYETNSLTDLLLNFLKDKQPAGADAEPQPFFAVLSVEPTHNPYIAPAEYAARYQAESIQLRANVPLHASLPAQEGQWRGTSVAERARQELAGYYAQQECWDANIGRIVQQLSGSGLLEDTHIMIFSDHGDMHGSHGMFLKTNPYEESVRIPMIISGSESFYEGHLTGTCEALFAAVDIAPTSLGLCGIQAPTWMEGHDLSGYRLATRVKARMPDSLYLQNVIPTGHPDSIDEPYRGLVSSDGWKLVCLPNEPWLMFNLAEDPYEEVNLAFNPEYSKQRKKLLHRLASWIEDTGDRFLLPV